MKNNKIAIVIFMALSLFSMYFVTWIGQMAYDNTSIELQEQHIGSEVSGIVSLIENSINFGKEISNYYGIDEELDEVISIREGSLYAVILDKEGEVLYVSSNMEKGDKSIGILKDLYGAKYQEEIAEIVEHTGIGTMVEIGSNRSLVFPISRNDASLVGHLVVIYDKDNLIEEEFDYDLNLLMLIIWAAINAVLILATLFMEQSDKWYIRFLPAIVIMIGMFIYIVFLYTTYRERYENMIDSNARMTAEYIQTSVDSLVEKGLPPEHTGQIGKYLDEKVAANETIGSIYIAKGYYDTSEHVNYNNGNNISLPIADGEAMINITVNEDYINDKMVMMLLNFGAIFVICLMITYELTHMVDIIGARLKPDFGEDTPEQRSGIGSQIKLISFLSYTAIYTSMPYAAVIMRSWDASVFSFSAAFSASLPLTVELLCIMVASLIIQKVFGNARMKWLIFLVFPLLILGNIACMRVDSPYLLIGLRAFCGIGFAFLKYWLNAYVAAGSESQKEVTANFGQLNAGLLGGITVGASLGSVLAQSFGYLFNYLFTAVICLGVLIFVWLIVPWKMIETRRKQSVGEASKEPVRIGRLLKSPSVLKAIILGDVPLNIGLMYVVAFLPVYMSNIGQPAVVTSYAYLINGLTGVYIGLFFLALLKRLRPKWGASFSLIMGAFGIIILVAGQNAGIVLASAAIMGLFDGYGTPTITGFFTSLPEVASADTASMLTLYSIVGSAVQIACPILYNMLIQPDGSTLYLLIFGIVFAAVGVVFPWLFKDKLTTSGGTINE